MFGSIIRRTSWTNCANADDIGSTVVLPVRITKDLGILGSDGFSVFLTWVRFLTLFFVMAAEDFRWQISQKITKFCSPAKGVKKRFVNFC